MLFCIDNENAAFLKHALQETVFTVQMLTDPEVVEKLLSTIETGRKIELCFNILIYTDFSRWKQTDIKRLINQIIEFTKESDEK